MTSFLVSGIFVLSRIDFSLGSVLPYLYQEYNALLPYTSARVYAFEDETINELGDILMNYGMNDTFGLCLLHNHFHLNDNEKLVEIVSNTTSNVDVVHNDNYTDDINNDINIKPYMFELTDNLDLKPMEFVDLSYSDFGLFTDEVQHRFSWFNQELISNDAFNDFLSVFYNKLSNTERVNIFGLCIKHRESINSADENWSTLETNHPKQRWLKIEPMVRHEWRHALFIEKWKRQEASSTFWSFPMNCECDEICENNLGTCAECSCGGGRCAECGCFV